VGNILTFIVGYGLGIFASTNVLLPLFWSWPKATRLAREGRLKRQIPVAGFVIAPVVWTLLALALWWLIAAIFPTHSFAYIVGLVAAGAQTTRLLFKPNKDMEDDFSAAYAAYLK
jgi:uncharacterized membrane protein YbhN (UPF0104 family)